MAGDSDMVGMSASYRAKAYGQVQEEGTQGFALLVVIWAIGLIALITLVMTTTSRSRLQASANLVDTAKAENLAEAGIGLAKIALARGFDHAGLGNGRASGGRPFFCAFSADAIAAISLEDEAGKVNLNLASAPMLSALFRAFGASDQEATILGRNVSEFTRVSINQSEAERHGDTPGSQTLRPKCAPMATSLELDQVMGMRRDLFEAVLPYVTVTSRRPGIDLRTASPVLLAGLSGASSPTMQAMLRQAQTIAGAAELPVVASDQTLPAAWNTPSSHTSFWIVADVMTAGGSFFSRETNVEWLSGDLGLRTLEWRRGRGRFRPGLEQLRKRQLSQAGASLPSCR